MAGIRDEDGVRRSDDSVHPGEVAFVVPETQVTVDLQSGREKRAIIGSDVEIPLYVSKWAESPSPQRALIGPHVDILTDERGELEESQPRRDRAPPTHTGPSPCGETEIGRVSPCPATVRAPARTTRPGGDPEILEAGAKTIKTYLGSPAQVGAAPPPVVGGVDGLDLGVDAGPNDTAQQFRYADLVRPGQVLHGIMPVPRYRSRPSSCPAQILAPTCSTPQSLSGWPGTHWPSLARSGHSKK